MTNNPTDMKRYSRTEMEACHPPHPYGEMLRQLLAECDAKDALLREVRDAATAYMQDVESRAAMEDDTPNVGIGKAVKLQAVITKINEALEE